jgi:hypothetical protein
MMRTQYVVGEDRSAKDSEEGSMDTTWLITEQKDIDRFWSKVDKQEDDDNCCWLWTDSVNGSGYGQFGFKNSEGERRNRVTHKLAWVLENGDVEDGLEVHHECYVRHCLRVSHLGLLTPKQNADDAKRAKEAYGEGWKGKDVEAYKAHNVEVCERKAKEREDRLFVKALVKEVGKAVKAEWNVFVAPMWAQRRKDYLKGWHADNRERQNAYQREYRRAKKAEAKENK